MDHVDYLLPDFVNGRLEESLKEGVESHLRECSRCREERESLEDMFSYLQANRPDTPTSAYFASILPRVRQRLEQRDTIPFFSRPMFVRLITPLAAGALAIVILFHVPLFETEPEGAVNPLHSVVRGTTTDELAEAVLEQSRTQPLVNGLSESEISSLVAAQLFLRRAVPGTVGPPSAASSEPLFNASTADAIETLTEEEVAQLLQRLGERTIL